MRGAARRAGPRTQACEGLEGLVVVETDAAPAGPLHSLVRSPAVAQLLVDSEGGESDPDRRRGYTVQAVEPSRRVWILPWRLPTVFLGALVPRLLPQFPHP